MLVVVVLVLLVLLVCCPKTGKRCPGSGARHSALHIPVPPACAEQQQELPRAGSCTDEPQERAHPWAGRTVGRWGHPRVLPAPMLMTHPKAQPRSHTRGQIPSLGGTRVGCVLGIPATAPGVWGAQSGAWQELGTPGTSTLTRSPRCSIRCCSADSTTRAGQGQIWGSGGCRDGGSVTLMLRPR